MGLFDDILFMKHKIDKEKIKAVGRGRVTLLCYVMVGGWQRLMLRSVSKEVGVASLMVKLTLCNG